MNLHSSPTSFSNALLNIGSIHLSPHPISSRTQVQCTSPSASAPGAVDVALVRNNGKYSVPLTFTYTAEEQKSSLRVEHIGPREGPLSGGTQVIVKGTGFGTGASDSFDCLFGKLVTEGLRLSETYVRCTSPKATEAGPVVVIVRKNGVAAMPTKESTFSYLSEDAFASTISLAMTGNTAKASVGAGAASSAAGDTEATTLTAESQASLSSASSSAASAEAAVDSDYVDPIEKSSSSMSHAFIIILLVLCAVGYVVAKKRGGVKESLRELSTVIQNNVNNRKGGYAPVVNA
jgi:hypothetical protein